MFDLRQFAGQLATTLSGKRPDPRIMATAQAIAGAGMAAEIIAAIFTEQRRAAPDPRVIGGCAFLLGSTLDGLRIAANGGDRQAAPQLERARQSLADQIAQGCDAPAVLLLVARSFAHAQLDPGAALRQAVGAALAEEAGMLDRGATRTLATDELAAMAAGLDHDPFAIHAELALSAAALPAEERLAFLAGIAGSQVPAIREAALGFVLDADAAVAVAVLDAIVQAKDAPTPSRLVERLMRMRPWVAPARRPGIDAALRSLRPKAAPPQAAPAPEITTRLASMADGAGAQSLFVTAKLGKRHVMASVLIKDGTGIAEAMLETNLPKTRVDGLLRMIRQEVEAREISAGFLERVLAAQLAHNLALGVPPPFGLVQLPEVLNLGPLQPLAQPAGELAAALLADREPVSGAGQEALLLLAEARMPVLASWFENGEAIDALLARHRTKPARLAAVLNEVLPTRRAFWAERCAWTAAVLMERPARGEEQLGPFFAQAARDFAGEVPLRDIPLARFIAQGSVDAAAAARRR